MKPEAQIQNNLRISFLQFNPLWENVEVNLQHLDQQVNGVDADILILPEAFATGFSMDAKKVAQSMNGEIVAWMKRKSKEHKIAICGSVFIEENDKFLNRFIWVDPQQMCFYDKRHLFSLGNEDQNYNRGHEQVIIEFKGWKIFPQICYDLRFPVWSRNTFNYDLMINVANWPEPRHEVWNTLLKARAIENQSYVVAVNRLGVDGNKVSHRGDSMVIDAKGNVLRDAAQNPDLMTTELDLILLHQFREKFNTLKDGDVFSLQD